MKNRKRTALILVPVFLVGLAGGIAWSQQGEGRRGEGARIARAEGGEERGGRHWRGNRGRRGQEGRHGRRGHEGLVKRMTRKLELTDEQVKKIKSVLTDARKKRIGLRADARIAGIELREMVSLEAVDKAKVGAKVDEIAKIRGEPAAGADRRRAGGTGGPDARADGERRRHAEAPDGRPQGPRPPVEVTSVNHERGQPFPAALFFVARRPSLFQHPHPRATTCFAASPQVVKTLTTCLK